MPDRRHPRPADHRPAATAHVTLEALDLDPYPILAALQAERSVTWIDGLSMWFVTCRADVVAVLRDTTTYSTAGAQSLIGDTFGPQMLSSEGGQHRRYKSQCAGPFNAAGVRRGIEDVVSPMIDGMLDALPRDGSTEFRRHIATPLSVATICATLGIPAPYADQTIAWYQAFRAALANFARDPLVRSRGHAAAAAFRAVFQPMLAGYGADAENRSLLAHLVRQPIERMTDDEILSNALIVLFGGIETTESAILNCLWCLLGHPEQLAMIRREPALLPNAVNETMRWEPAVQSCTRHSTTDATLGDAHIQAGDMVQCLIGAANRDPAHFADPHTFDIRRSNAADHIAFGSGAHFCLGAALARGEITQLMTGLLQRFPELSLADGAAETPRGFEFRAPAQLHVTVGRGGSPVVTPR